MLVSVEIWWREGVDNPLLASCVLKEALRNAVSCGREGEKNLCLGLGKWASLRHLEELRDAFIYP